MSDGLVLAFPAAASMERDQAVHWWLVSDGRIVDRGKDIDPLAAAGLEDPLPDQVMALAPASETVVRWFDLPDVTGVQAESAARLEAASLSIGGSEENHIAAQQTDTDAGEIVTATIAKPAMAYGLARLSAIGIDPAMVLPSALVLQSAKGETVAATIGEEQVLRAHHFAAAYDPSLAAAFREYDAAKACDGDALDTALLAAFAAPQLNLRQGAYAMRNNRHAIPAKGWRVLALLALLGLMISLATLGVQLWKYEGDAQRLDAEALAAAQKLVPEAADLPSAEQKLDELLARQGKGPALFGIPASALFAAIQNAPGVSVRDLQYRSDGVVTIQLAAPRSEDINTVLIALQDDGYKVTANPRQDSSGQTVADVTVRGI